MHCVLKGGARGIHLKLEVTNETTNIIQNRFFIGINGSIWNIAIAQNVLYSAKKLKQIFFYFENLLFTLKMNTVGVRCNCNISQ